MGSDAELRVAPQRAISSQGLLLKHIEYCPSQLSCRQCVQQIVNHQMAAPPDIDHHQASCLLPQCRVEQASGGGRQRQGVDQVITTGQRLLQCLNAGQLITGSGRGSPPAHLKPELAQQ